MRSDVKVVTAYIIINAANVLSCWDLNRHTRDSKFLEFLALFLGFYHSTMFCYLLSPYFHDNLLKRTQNIVNDFVAEVTIQTTTPMTTTAITTTMNPTTLADLVTTIGFSVTTSNNNNNTTTTTKDVDHTSKILKCNCVGTSKQ